MMTFDWDAFKNKSNYIAVHCQTEEEAKDFCKQMHEHGFKWYCGSYLTETKWSNYKEKTYYGNHGTYGTKAAYMTSGYRTFLEWQDYMDGDRVETVEEFLKRKGKGDYCEEF